MELTDDLKWEQILRAAKIAMEDGNYIVEISDGWSKVQQVAHMGRELSPTTKQRIKLELPSLRYWNSPKTPHNPASEGFISDDEKAGISFPKLEAPFDWSPYK
ncbi:MAG: hypothetical protein WBG81_12880 [Rhodanobacter sp.]|jgi:hypothetical protein|uniref:hypothetical protein n=1 Tax=Rhodanobacter sp. KK11 TaxID=3083255 RepID=UPI0029663B3A|nr:hypothetical protein [Rhodanobacter sp. KK11]MDW2982550.1 hypothetical protein [Rhodanobacter sp. KK11]